MFGWIIVNEKLCDSYISKFEYIENNQFTILMNKNLKFKEDKIFFENSDYIVILDGIIYNKKELEKKYKCKLVDIIIELYRSNPQDVPKSLRGTFSGLIFEKNNQHIYIYTNHIGDGGVFYLNQRNKILIGNNFNLLVDIMKLTKMKYTLDINAVKYMCTFGYMLDNTTYIKSIKRLLGGEEIYISNDEMIHIGRYHDFTNENLNHLTENEYIEGLDFYFRQAVKRGFEKDREYGYTSLVDLSGGLDSRIVNFVAKDMGFENIVNISFSQAMSDEYIAMIEVSRKLRNKIIHYPLDNATHLYDIDQIVFDSYGLSQYAGAGAIISILNDLDPNVYGLEHGGILGDIADGVFPGKHYREHKKATLELGMPFSKVLSLDILDGEVVEQYPNVEMFQIKTRGMLGAVNTHFLRNNFGGYHTPFGDVDFYEFFLSIPLGIRGKGEIQRKWIEAKYPEAFDVIEDKLMCKPNANNFVKEYKKFKKKINSKVVQYFGKRIKNKAMNNMNPRQYWYETNDKLRNFIDNYYENNIDKLQFNEEALEIVRKLYYKGNVNDKLIALTVLAVAKLYF